MIALALPMIGTVGLLMVVFIAIQCLISFFWLNCSIWLADQVGKESSGLSMWAKPTRWLAFYLAMIPRGVELIVRRLSAEGQSRFEVAVWILVAQFLAAALLGGHLVQDALPVKFPRSVAIAAMTFIATTLSIGAVAFLSSQVIRTATEAQIQQSAN